MFVYFTKEDGTKRYVNPNLMEGFAEGKIEGRIVCYVYTIEGLLELTPEQYNEIMAQLDALGLLYKPSEPLPDVGEPLREIVGSRLMDFMNTKGRTD